MCRFAESNTDSLVEDSNADYEDSDYDESKQDTGINSQIPLAVNKSGDGLLFKTIQVRTIIQFLFSFIGKLTSPQNINHWDSVLENNSIIITNCL